jgi:hypothetical protein
MLRSAVKVKGGTGREYSGAFQSAVQFQAGHWPTLTAMYRQQKTTSIIYFDYKKPLEMRYNMLSYYKNNRLIGDAQ